MSQFLVLYVPVHTKSTVNLDTASEPRMCPHVRVPGIILLISCIFVFEMAESASLVYEAQFAVRLTLAVRKVTKEQ